MTRRLKWVHAWTYAVGYGTAFWFIAGKEPDLAVAYGILASGSLLYLAELALESRSGTVDLTDDVTDAKPQ
jgi:hypothetical protein